MARRKKCHFNDYPKYTVQSTLTVLIKLGSILTIGEEWKVTILAAFAIDFYKSGNASAV